MMLEQARGRRGPVPRAAPPLLAQVQEPALRGAMTAALRAELHQALAASWARGWQPADLDRAARRHKDDLVTTTLVDGVRSELDSYPRSTVDPRWWRQLDEMLEATPGGEAGSRAARGRPGDDPVVGWREACSATLRAICLLERLPALLIIGALPGERVHSGREHGPVDDKVLTRVRRLLAQAEGTPYEAEAETFTAAAQSLMAKHRIDRAVLDSTDPERTDRQPEAVRIGVDRPYEAPKMQLLHQICEANRCRSVWSPAVGFATVIGFESDRRAVELLYTSLLVQATTAMRREGELRGEQARTRGFRSSFLLGYAVRIGQRLQEASRTEETAAAAALAAGGADASDAPHAPIDPWAPPTSPDLTLVLSRRDDEVAARTRELFPHLQATRRRAVTDYGGFLQGGSAADRADLGTAAALTGRAS